MTSDQADMIITRLMAAWNPLDPSARAVWREHLEGLRYEHALAAIRLLEASNPRRPSIAEFRAAYRMDLEHNRKPSMLEDSSVAPDSRHRFRDVVEFMQQPRSPITAAALDAAGVAHWRDRLESALAEDRERGTQRRSYDEAWRQIRSELGRAELLLPDGSTFGRLP